ncbi:MAG TPA: zf-TFIIB domain-containing protein [Blastocatellia bacterium]|nr:zf-TFIIB domain-containing protein [Blastocatellia bacterium]
MSESWNDRKKALEEDYFRRKEQEAVEKMRAKREADQAKASATGCPKCDGTLVEINHDGVLVDRCDKCEGVWLDKGELERLTEREENTGWLRRLIGGA